MDGVLAEAFTPALTAIAALSGVFITQWRADERDRRSRQLDHRHTTYLGLLRAVRQTARNVDAADERGEPPPPDLDENWLRGLWDMATVDVRVYGTDSAYHSARDLIKALDQYGYDPNNPTAQTAYGEAESEYIREIRKDLKIE